MKKFLVVVDMQKDFVDGSLGTKEAVAIVPNVINKINDFSVNLTEIHIVPDYRWSSQGHVCWYKEDLRNEQPTVEFHV